MRTKSEYLSIINLIAVAELILIVCIQTTVCNPTRKHQHYSRNQHNSIIYAKVGESINISCWFDPNSLTLLTRSRFRPADFVIDDDDDDTWSRGRTKRDLRRQQKKRNTDAQANRYFSRKSFTADNHDGGGDNDDEERSEIYNKPSFRLDEAKENNWDKKVANRYELDWYFWDKDGKFKIISYGNLTASNYKYKTFVTREELSHVSPRFHSSRNGGASSAASAALYSQQTTSSKSASSPIAASSTLLSPNKFIYTYYLNALIESEQDEGVYQCINPDSPNLILRNVTVLIANNNASKRMQINLVDVFRMSLYLSYLIFFYKRLYLF